MFPIFSCPIVFSAIDTSCNLFVRVSDQHESLCCTDWSLSTFYFGCLLLYYFLFLIEIVSVNVVKVIIFVNRVKQ